MACVKIFEFNNIKEFYLFKMQCMHTLAFNRVVNVVKKLLAQDN